MPSPFTHLYIAEKIQQEINNQHLEKSRLAKTLAAGWAPFYFGSVAPDYQALSGQPREMTHFFKLPPEPGNQAYPRMFSQHPQLAAGDQIPNAQAAFVAGYAAHLLLDLIWFREVLIPFFHLAPDMGDYKERHLLHLILLTYIDKMALKQLPETAGQTLAQADPAGWLPFASDSDLKQWQGFLVPQLQPGAKSETVRIYADRLGMTAEAFAAKLDDQAWMNEKLFSRIPIDVVLDIVSTAVPKSMEMMNKYLAGGFAKDSGREANKIF